MTKFYLKSVQYLCKNFLEKSQNFLSRKSTLIQKTETNSFKPVSFTLFTFTLFTFILFTTNTFAQNILYPKTVAPCSLVEISHSSDSKVNYLILEPLTLDSKTYENNKYLTFAAPPNGIIVIVIYSVNYDTKKSNLEKIVIKVIGPVPNPPVPVPVPVPVPTPPVPTPPVPNPVPVPTGLDKLTANWISLTPGATTAKVVEVGNNYIIAANEVSSNSVAPRDEMIGRVKVLNLQTLGASATRIWAGPFFIPLAKWMDTQGISPTDYIAQHKLFITVGSSIKKALK